MPVFHKGAQQFSEYITCRQEVKRENCKNIKVALPRKTKVFPMPFGDINVVIFRLRSKENI